MAINSTATLTTSYSNTHTRNKTFATHDLPASTKITERLFDDGKELCRKYKNNELNFFKKLITILFKFSYT